MDRRGFLVAAGAGVLAPVRRLGADAPPQHVTFSDGRAFVTSGDDGTLRPHSALTGELISRSAVPTGSYNVQEGLGLVVSPSLSRGTVCIFDGRGRPLARSRARRMPRASRCPHKGRAPAMPALSLPPGCVGG